MKKFTYALLFLLLLVFSLSTKTTTHALSDIQSSPNNLIAAVNALRAANGLPPYASHPILMQIAQAHADYMAATGSVTHYGPGGERPFQRALNAGYPLAGDLSQGGFFSENIVAGRFTAQQAVEIWQGDAPHLHTMLSPNLQDVGAGVTKVGDFIYYVIDAGLASGSPINYTPNAPGGTTGAPGVSQYIIPVTNNTPEENGLVYHEVQSGQSLWAIAIAYGVKIDEIRKLNNLPADAAIYPGDRLLVRKDATPIPVSATATFTLSPVLFAPTAHLTDTQPAPSMGTSQTPEPPSGRPASSSATGVVVGIILATLLVAGLLTWAGANKQN